MTDLITAEEAGKLAHKYRFANNDLERVLCETARTVIALHAQLADAEAAQAAVVEKVAKLVHDICKTDAHACRGTSPEMSRDRDEYAEDLPIAIRDLASASGVETLTKLRARAEKAEQERAAEWNRRRDADGSRDAARAACDTLRIERDRLAAANAVLEAKVAGLRSALIWARDRIDVDGGMTDAETARTAKELLKVLQGQPSPASAYAPEAWQSPTLAALATGENDD